MSRGRPRKIDPNLALDKAMNVFWEKGFDGTSMSELVVATEMAKPGLYANFGDKEELFGKALSHYFDNVGSPLLTKFGDSTGSIKSDLGNLLRETLEGVLSGENPTGCFVVNSMIECPNKSQSLQELTQEIDEKRRKIFHKRFIYAFEKGEFSNQENIKDLSDYYAAQMLVIGLMTRAGAEKSMIEDFIETTLKLMPLK